MGRLGVAGHSGVLRLAAPFVSRSAGLGRPGARLFGVRESAWMSRSAACPCRHQLANSSAARETLVLSAIATRAGLGLEKNRVLVCVLGVS